MLERFCFYLVPFLFFKQVTESHKVAFLKSEIICAPATEVYRAWNLFFPSPWLKFSGCIWQLEYIHGSSCNFQSVPIQAQQRYLLIRLAQAIEPLLIHSLWL